MDKRNFKNMKMKEFLFSGGTPGFLLMCYPLLLAFISRQRSIQDSGTIDFSALVQIMFCIGSILICINNNETIKITKYICFNTPIYIFIIYNSVCLLSSIWSINSNLTIYRSFECFAFLILIISTLSSVYIRLGINKVYLWIINYCILLIIFGALKRSILWGFPFFSLNTFGMEQMNSTPFFFFALFLSLPIILKVVILSIAIVSKSNTAYLGILLGFLGLINGSNKSRMKLIGLIIILFFISQYLGFNQFLLSTVFYEKTGVGIEYISGRDIIWKQGVIEGLKKPFLGYGFVAGEVYFINNNLSGVMGAHNGFLSAFLGTGMIGFLIYLLFYIKLFFISCSRYLPHLMKQIFISSFIFLFVYNFGNPGLGTRVYGCWISSMLIFSTICISEIHYRIKARGIE